MKRIGCERWEDGRKKIKSFVKPVNREAIICKKWLFVDSGSYNTCLRTPILQLLHIWYMELKLEKLETDSSSEDLSMWLR